MRIHNDRKLQLSPPITATSTHKLNVLVYPSYNLFNWTVSILMHDALTLRERVWHWHIACPIISKWLPLACPLHCSKSESLVSIQVWAFHRQPISFSIAVDSIILAKYKTVQTDAFFTCLQIVSQWSTYIPLRMREWVLLSSNWKQTFITDKMSIKLQCKWWRQHYIFHESLIYIYIYICINVMT